MTPSISRKIIFVGRGSPMRPCGARARAGHEGRSYRLCSNEDGGAGAFATRNLLVKQGSTSLARVGDHQRLRRDALAMLLAPQ
eukprot:3872745-Prymnesium_polylepis.1